MITALIIKPTELCNFKCTFCSSTSIADNATDTVSVDDIKRIISRHPTIRQVIINGGDPLMMPDHYYHDLLDFMDIHVPDAFMSFTSNLWIFYKHPEKWSAVFNRRNARVITSFQYGGERLKGDLTPYSEEDFWNVSDTFLEYCGYRPDFITVITNKNKDDALKTVRLAKAMGVNCKLNPVTSSGPQVSFKSVTMGSEGTRFLLADTYEIYLDIIRSGLGDWERHSANVPKLLLGQVTTCPVARNCDSGMRTIHPSGRYYSCPSLAHDDVHRIDFDTEMSGEEITTPLSTDPTLVSMKQSCFSCPMFIICNSCRKTIKDHKALGLVEEHCKKMKTLAPEIIALNGLEESLTPTPYVDESTLIFKTNHTET